MIRILIALALTALACGQARAQGMVSRYSADDGGLAMTVILGCASPTIAARVAPCSASGGASSVTNAPLVYANVAVGTTSSTVLVAAPATRTALDLWNTSGRGNGTAGDAWCAFGTPAVLYQGFPLFGGGGNVARNLPSVIDARALNCIAAVATTLSVGVTQQ